MFKWGLSFFLFCSIAHSRVQFSFESLFTTESSQVLNTSINPSNLVFKLPTEENDADLRAELKWSENSFLTVIRPRFSYQNQKIYNFSQHTAEIQNKNHWDLTDAFIENTWSSYLSTTLGLQVYQWGPAEFINPTNPFFHFNSQQKSLYYKEKGQALIRANISPNQQHNIVLVAEPVSNNEAEWQEGHNFYTKWAIKYEKSWKGTFNSLGLVTGSGENNIFFIGEYFNYSFKDSFSIYADIKHSQKKENYEPEYNGTNYDLVVSSEKTSSWPILAVSGIRYEGNFDLRLEYIYNSAGYDKQKLSQAYQAAANFYSLNYAQNLKRFLKPGLEMLGEQYIYTSLRIADPFKTKDFNVYGRYIYSLQDQSSQIQAELEKSFLDAFNAFISQSYSFGTDHSEFRILNDWRVLAGLKWNY